MLTIKIHHDEANRMDLVNYLEHVANLVDQGYQQGEDWSLTGVDEDETAEPIDIPEEELPQFSE